MSPRTAEHEAGHAACALLLGHQIDGIEMKPEQGIRAWSLIPMLAESVTLDHVAIVLAGGMAAGEADGTGCKLWPPPWPLPKGERGDLRKLGALCRCLQVTESAYERTVELTRELIRSDEFARLHRVITVMLEICDAIDGQSLLLMRQAFEEEGAVG